MSNIIEHNDRENLSGEVVSILDNSSQVSIKTYQDIYHQITGRTEQIKQRYNDNVLLEFSEIEQLHFKIKQLCDVYNVIASNESVTVFHEKERKEQFTSFERFKAYNSSSTRPTLNVVLRYNFSILASGRKQPQEYVITIRLTSRVGVLHAMEEEVPNFMKGRFLNFATIETAEISVEYVDYVVARSFLEAADEWLEGCDKKSDNKLLGLLQSKSHLIPKITQLMLAAVFFYFCLNSFSEISSDVERGRFFIVYGVSFYFLVAISGMAGRLIESAVDSVQQLSYLKLNRGDERLISEFSNRKTHTVWRFIWGCLINVMLGILSSKLSPLI